MITVNNAINLVPGVKKQDALSEILKNVDILTIHIPYKNETKDFISMNEINLMKNTATIINLSREEIVNTDAVIEALENKKLDTYVTDFPNESLIGNPDVLLLPHLGASTKEAEANCAVMVANSIKSYLENGDIINSVNFPDVSLVSDTKHRLTITILNKPNIV